LARPRLTGDRSVSQVEQQNSRPHRPSPPRRAVSSRAPIWRRSMRVRSRVPRSRTRLRKSTRESAVKNTVRRARSHCHSVSTIFIARPCSRVRSRTRWRTVSSWRRLSMAVAASSAVARRTMARETGGGAPAAHPAQDTAHLASASVPSALTRPRSSPRSASTITGSLTPKSSGAPVQRKYSLRFPLNRTSIGAVITPRRRIPWPQTCPRGVAPGGRGGCAGVRGDGGGGRCEEPRRCRPDPGGLRRGARK